MKIIHQGKSARKYFVIARPYPSDPKEIKPGETLLLRHPRSQNECTVEVSKTHWWQFLWADVPDSFCLLNFGINTAELRQQLEANYLEFKNSEYVKFWLVEEVK